MAETVPIAGDDAGQAPDGHDEQMANLADGVKPEAEEEKLLAGKYKTVEEMEKGYKELESRLGQPKEEEQEATEETTDLKIDTPSETDGLDLNAMSERYAEQGELPAKDYEALEKAGISKDIVDQYIEGQNALAQSHFNSITSEVGGAESYGDMTTWAESNLSEGEIDAFNRAVDSDVHTARLAVQGLKAKYDSVNGVEPSLTGGDSSGTATDVYTSMAQLQRDMASSDYKSDSAERMRVQNKLARSNIM